MKFAEQSIDRLRGILKKDKENISPQFINLVKTDIYRILSGYFVTEIKDIDIKYRVENGKYYFNIDFSASNIKHNTFFVN